CCHTSPPFSPYTLILILFSSPAAICVANKEPLAPFSNFNNTLPSSSSFLPGTTIFISAQIFVTFNPLTYSARLKACVPISPMPPAIPLWDGSVRHAACLKEFVSASAPSRKLLSQPCGYSTYTLRTLPSLPLRTSCLASFTMG